MDKYAYPIITNLAFQLYELSEAQKGSAEKEYQSTTKEALYEYAKERKVLPFVANLAIRLNLDVDFWQKTTDFYTERNKNIVKVLDIIYQAFEKNGVKKCYVSQNFGALLASGTDISLFASGDVDMHGDYTEREAIEKTFGELGFERKDRYCGKRLISSDYYNEALLPEQFAVGIEYDTLSRLKLPEPIKAENFVDWNRLVSYADTSIKLPQIDALTYICLVHISLHSFSRAPDIRLYIDIENCLKAGSDLENVMAFAKRDKTVVRVLTAFILTKKLFGTDLDKCVQDVALEYDKRLKKLLKLVYDEEKNSLIYEPKRINTLRIELCYYDDGKGLTKMLFPDKKWKKEVYGDGIIADIKHIARIFR